MAVRRLRGTRLALAFTATFLTACSTSHAAGVMPTGGDWAYVTSADGIVPFNLTTHRTGQMISVPLWNSQQEVGVAADGRTGVTTNEVGIVPLNFVTGKPSNPLPTRRNWAVMALAPDGRTLWVTDLEGGPDTPVAQTDTAIVPVSTSTGKPGRPIPVPGGPVGINISPDGRTAWLATGGGANLTEVSLPLGLVGYVIPVPDGVGGLAIAPNGKMAYAVGTVVDQVGSYSDSYVTPIDLVTGVAEPPIVLHYDPYGIAVSPDGRTIWVTGGTVDAGPNSGTPDLRSISLATGRVDGDYSIPGGADDIVNATSGG
jgi:DNA-binding beta-propeller fold protein YncE